MAELEKRIHRFEVGEAKLEQLFNTPTDKEPGQQEAIESNLKAFRKELADMRNLQRQLAESGATAADNSES